MRCINWAEQQQQPTVQWRWHRWWRSTDDEEEKEERRKSMNECVSCEERRGEDWGGRARAKHIKWYMRLYTQLLCNKITIFIVVRAKFISSFGRRLYYYYYCCGCVMDDGTYSYAMSVRQNGEHKQTQIHTIIIIRYNRLCICVRRTRCYVLHRKRIARSRR